MEGQTKSFPIVDILEISTKGDDINQFTLNCSHAISEKLFGASAIHKDVFEYNLGITNNEFLSNYKQKPAISSGSGNGKSMGAEFFAMLKTNKDVRVEFEGSQELKRLR